MECNNRTLVIPGGTLNGDVTNVVILPDEQQVNNCSLVVQPRPMNRPFPLNNREWVRPGRLGTSLDGSRGRAPPPDNYDRDFGIPPATSSFQDEIDDDYYFDMYDTSNDRFVGGSSGDLDGSALQNILGGQMNVICGAGVPAPDSPGEAAGGPLPEPEPRVIRCPVAEPSRRATYNVTGDREAEMSMYEPQLTCGPCFPGRGGNPNLCPPTCPVQRGIPYGDLHRLGDYLPDEDQPDPPADFGRTRVGPILDRTRPVLNRTRPALDRTRPAPNRAGPIPEPARPVRRPITRFPPPVILSGNRAMDCPRPVPSAPPNISVVLNRTRPGGCPAMGAPSQDNLNVTVNMNRPEPAPCLYVQGEHRGNTGAVPRRRPAPNAAPLTRTVTRPSRGMVRRPMDAPTPTPARPVNRPPPRGVRNPTRNAPPDGPCGRCPPPPRWRY